MVTRSRARQAAPPVLGLLLDIPMLRDEHVDVPGIYVAATLEDPIKPWRGFTLFESNSQDSGYIRRNEYGDRASIGRVISDTGLPVDHRLIDYANTIRVEMLHPNDRLESVTEQEMLIGKNRFLVDSELLGAANARLVSTDAFTGLRTYDLSVLRRGIKGTFLNPFNHVPNELLVGLDYGGVYFYPYAVSRIGEQSYFKFVSNGGLLALAPARPFALGGSTVKPLSPVSVVGVRDGSNNLTVTWERQGRRSIQALDQAVPIDEEVERTKIHVLASAGSDTALRTTIVTSTRTWTYTAGQHVTDGLTPGDPVSLSMNQMGTIVPAGFAIEVTL